MDEDWRANTHFDFLAPNILSIYKDMLQVLSFETFGSSIVNYDIFL